ncbi:MAG: LpxD N-terminal domain-containing protein, partial [Planctomycetota bacterium]
MKTVAEVAEILGADVDGDPSVLLRRLHPIGSAEEGDLTYIAKERHPPPPEELKASAAILHQGVDRDRLPARLTLLRMENPDLGFARAISLFFPPPDHPFEGISPAAHIDRSVELGEGVRIAPGAFVGAGTRLADRVVLYPGVDVVARRAPHAAG